MTQSKCVAMALTMCKYSTTSLRLQKNGYGASGTKVDTLIQKQRNKTSWSSTTLGWKSHRSCGLKTASLAVGRGAGRLPIRLTTSGHFMQSQTFARDGRSLSAQGRWSARYPAWGLNPSSICEMTTHLRSSMHSTRSSFWYLLPCFQMLTSQRWLKALKRTSQRR